MKKNKSITTKNDNLKMALENGQAEVKYEDIIEIYPRKFMNEMVLSALLTSLTNDYEFFKVMNVIRAFKRSDGTSHIEYQDFN